MGFTFLAHLVRMVPIYWQVVKVIWHKEAHRRRTHMDGSVVGCTLAPLLYTIVPLPSICGGDAAFVKLLWPLVIIDGVGGGSGGSIGGGRDRSSSSSSRFVIIFIDGYGFKNNACLAVAEMGDRFVTIDMGRKEGGMLCPFRGGGGWVPIWHLGWGLPPYQVASWSI